MHPKSDVRQLYLDVGRRDMLKKYGLTIADFERMLEDQVGVCAICCEPETTRGRKNLSVDHCHDTGRVRGLLCRRCNQLLFSLKGRQKLIRAALNYLERFG